MITSMTGFGRGELRKNGYEISAEIRSVNNRFLDLQLKLPKSFSHLENEVKTLVRNYVNRGRVNVFVSLKSSDENNGSGLTINLEPARVYWKLIKRLKKELKIPGKVKFDHLLHFTDVFTYEEDSGFNQELWELIEQALTTALDNLQQMRKQEGAELANDLIARIKALDAKIIDIEKISKQRAGDDLAKLRERVKEILSNGEVEESRLNTEIALMVNRMDVTEECVRFHSHNKMFLDMFQFAEAAGRKMNFLLQEMTREANTVGAKANHADIAHLVVDIKEEIEKIREQVQNIE
ncbi:MAG TPA: YicC/YloC family endoribonuclease [bacterium]